MYVPATPTQPAVPAVPLIPIQAITTGGSTPGVAGLTGLGAAPAHVSITVRRPVLNVLADHASTIAGALRADLRSVDLSGKAVALQALGARGWRTIAGTRIGRGGRFRVRYVPRHTGSERVRLRFAGDAGDLGAHRSLGRLNVYRLAEASWYGGGGGLACGGELTSTTMGVANKTLPCGTQVTLRYGKRTVRVRVIDRGPYVAGREYDLTEATRRALGFGDTGEVWSTR
jgi:rare lipoprotein A